MMTLTEPDTLAVRPFLAAARRFASGDDTPRAFLERCLATIAAREPAVGAFVELDAERARAAADRSAARWRGGRGHSPIGRMPIGLQGVPGHRAARGDPRGRLGVCLRDRAARWRRSGLPAAHWAAHAHCPKAARDRGA